jgi:hypothetical protein
VQKSWAENVANIKPIYDFFRASIPPFDLMKSLCPPRKSSTSARKRQLGQEKYPNLLRALDAFAAGEKLPRIAEYRTKGGSDTKDLLDHKLEPLVKGTIWRDEHFKGKPFSEIARENNCSRSFVVRLVHQSLEIA